MQLTVSGSTVADTELARVVEMTPGLAPVYRAYKDVSTYICCLFSSGSDKIVTCEVACWPGSSLHCLTPLFNVHE